MTLLAIIIALSLGHFLGHVQELRQFGWFERLSGWVQTNFKAGGEWNGAAGVLLAVLPPVLVVALVQDGLDEGLLGFLGFVFAVLVLLYTLGPRDLDQDAETYIDALETGDEEKARRSARAILETEPPEQAGERTRLVADTLLVKANEAVFAVLFWFALLGPAGAVLYRLAWVLKEKAGVPAEEAGAFAVAAGRLHGILAWLPARLLAVGYALVGSFEEAIHAWRNYRDRWSDRFGDSNVGVLVCAGNGALHRSVERDAPVEDSVELGVEWIRGVLGLIWRTLVLWVTVIALLTLAGWAS